MTLATDEFIRRFLIHVLPKGFHRIRHYGLLAKTSGADNIARARELLAGPKPQSKPADADATDRNQPACPCCGGRIPRPPAEIFHARRSAVRSPRGDRGG
jgi:hypothetical protein